MNPDQYGGGFGDGYGANHTSGGYGEGGVNDEYGGNSSGAGYGGNGNSAEGAYKTGGFGDADPNDSGADNSYSAPSVVVSPMNSAQFGSSFGGGYGVSGTNGGFDRGGGSSKGAYNTEGYGDADPNESGA
jgi:hypothetical protein